VREPGLLTASALVLALIHPSAWMMISPMFVKDSSTVASIVESYSAAEPMSFRLLYERSDLGPPTGNQKVDRGTWRFPGRR
jgi:hypothetical protein